MQLLARAAIDIARPINDVFDQAVAPEGLMKIMRPFFPIPGVDQVHMIDGAPVQAGARREVTLSDGTKMVEELMKVDRPTLCRYRWASRLRPPLSLLVRAGETDWIFTASGNGTHIEWIYRLDLTSPLVYPLAGIMVWRFRGWMERSLANLRALLA